MQKISETVMRHRSTLVTDTLGVLAILAMVLGVLALPGM